MADSSNSFEPRVPDAVLVVILDNFDPDEHTFSRQLNDKDFAIEMILNLIKKDQKLPNELLIKIILRLVKTANVATYALMISPLNSSIS